jgi:heptaprenyl diphosphate synthase
MPSRADTTTVIARTGLLLASAAVLGYLETVFLPGLPVPGVRLGLGNLAVLLAFAVVGPRNALAVAAGKVLIVALATSTLFGPITALSGTAALAAWCATALVYARGEEFSPIGWSMAGSTAHVGAQLVVASLLTGTTAPLLMAPVSLALALVAGIIMGALARLLLARIPSPRTSLALQEG